MTVADRYNGKVAVVTGAASGIGRAITHRFVACKPMVVYLSDQRQAWIDDLAAVESGPLEDASVAGLAKLVSGSGLRVVAEQ